MPIDAFDAPGASAPGDVAREGVSGAASRADHQHAREAGSSSSTVSGWDGKPLTMTPPTSANSHDDEFNDATGMSGPVKGLNARWSKHNLGTSSWLVLDDAQAPGCLFFDIPSGQAQDQAIYQAAPAGDFTVTARYQFGGETNRQMWGVFIVDSSGAGICVPFDDPASDTTNYIRTLSAWVNATAPVVVSSYFNSLWIAGVPLTASIRKSGTTYAVTITAGDRIKPVALREFSTTSGITVAYIGFGRIFDAGTSAGKVALDYMRVT